MNQRNFPVLSAKVQKRSVAMKKAIKPKKQLIKGTLLLTLDLLFIICLNVINALIKKKKKVSNASTVSLLTVFPSFIPLVFVANRSLHFLLPNCFPYRFNNISVVLVNAVSFCQFTFMHFKFSFSHAGASCWSLFLLLLWVPMRLLLICCLIM